MEPDMDFRKEADELSELYIHALKRLLQADEVDKFAKLLSVQELVADLNEVLNTTHQEMKGEKS